MGVKIKRRPIAEIDSPIIPGRGWIDLALSALAAGLYAMMITGALGLVVYALADLDLAILLKVGFVTLLTGLLVAGIVGLKRMFIFERILSLQTRSIARNWRDRDLEHARIKTLWEGSYEPENPGSPMTHNEAQINSVAELLIHRHAAGKSISRSIVVDRLQLCPATTWNDVMELFVKRGLRKKAMHGLHPDLSLFECLSRWREGRRQARSFRFDDRGGMIPQE